MIAGYARNHSLSIADDAYALIRYWNNKGTAASFIEVEGSAIWMEINNGKDKE